MPHSKCLIALLLVCAAEAAEQRTFHRVLPLESKGETSASVSLGDIDGDGDLDIVLAKGRHWPLHDLILRNNGKGVFQAETLSVEPDRTYSLALADLDGDGDLDIVSSNDKPDKKLVYKNDGKGSYKVSGEFGDPAWATRYVTLADVNGDKRPDVLVANRNGNSPNPRHSQVCLNDAKGAFPKCTPLLIQSATIIVAADFDGDGAVDLLIPHRDGGQSLIFWSADQPDPFGAKAASIRAAAAGDIDSDGKIDIVVGDEEAGLFYYRNLGARKFADPIALGAKGIAPYSIAIADMNRDGRPDIVVGNQRAPGGVFYNEPAKFQETKWGDGKGSVYGLAIGDLDGDGWPDIAAARSDAPNCVWFSGPPQP